MKRNFSPFVMAAILAVFLLALGLVGPAVTQVNAQTKGEICDNGIDDDGDKLIDCDDPDCDCTPPPTEICDNGIDDDGDKLIDCDDPDCDCTPEGQLCSPGYWKNHESEFLACCVQVSGWTCDELWTAVNCKGNNATCRRSEAGDLMSTTCGCFE